MTWLDYAVIAVIVISTLFGVVRGFARELMAIVAWTLAFVAARLGGEEVASWMPAILTDQNVRMVAGYVVVFIVVLLALTLVGIGMAKLIKGTAIASMDRTMGGLFGLIRGVALVTLAILLAGLTALPAQPIWKQGVIIAPFQNLAIMVKQAWLPKSMADKIKY